jgi:hypothetical protein
MSFQVEYNDVRTHLKSVTNFVPKLRTNNMERLNLVSAVN